MAVDVNDVYQTVLLILNKEQRGYMTPDEFNKIATQVQLEIFEKYFEDLNQLIRTPQADTDYSDRIKALDQKLEIFKTESTLTVIPGPPIYFRIPADLYRIGSLTYEATNILPVEMQRTTRGEFYNIRMSSMTTPTERFPIYLLENNGVYAYPNIIGTNAIAATHSVNMQYIKTPEPVYWNYTINSVGAFVHDTTFPPDQDFELDISERTEIILAILVYAGIVIRDPQIVQAASSQLQADRVNAKS